MKSTREEIIHWEVKCWELFNLPGLVGADTDRVSSSHERLAPSGCIHTEKRGGRRCIMFLLLPDIPLCAFWILYLFLLGNLKVCIISILQTIRLSLREIEFAQIHPLSKWQSHEGNPGSLPTPTRHWISSLRLSLNNPTALWGRSCDSLFSSRRLTCREVKWPANSHLVMIPARVLGLPQSREID